MKFRNWELKLNRHNVFLASIIFKGLNGFLEIMGGVFTLIVAPEIVKKIIGFLTQGEIFEDPKDLIANYFLHIFSSYNVSLQIFWALYLLIHGVIKIFLVASLMQKKLWAYPLAMGVFLAFIAYQVYQYSLSPSVFLIILSLFDVFVIIMTYFEYKSVKEKIVLNKID